MTQKIIVSPSTEVEHGTPWNICLNNGEILAQLATSNVDLNASIVIDEILRTTSNVAEEIVFQQNTVLRTVQQDSKVVFHDPDAFHNLNCISAALVSDCMGPDFICLFKKFVRIFNSALDMVLVLIQMTNWVC